MNMVCSRRTIKNQIKETLNMTLTNIFEITKMLISGTKKYCVNFKYSLNQE